MVLADDFSDRSGIHSRRTVALKGNMTKLFIDECLSAELALMARERAVP